MHNRDGNTGQWCRNISSNRSPCSVHGLQQTNVCIMAIQNDLIDLSGDFPMDDFVEWLLQNKDAEPSLQTAEPIVGETKRGHLSSIWAGFLQGRISPNRRMTTKISEHQTRKGTRKIWCLLFDALSTIRIGANKVDWHFARTCGGFTTKSLWSFHYRICQRRLKRKGETEWRNGVFFKICLQRIRKIEKRVRNNLVVRHSYAYELRKIETKESIANFQNERSLWFERLSEVKQWLEEQDKKRL